jgi:CheY-like chemotaxis protein
MMSSPASGPRKIVLVVEDEPLLRMMAVDIIEEAGFEALEAGNATEAVLILEQRTDIRLVFTDIDMPGGLDGVRLAALIRDRWPPIELIITSGNHAMKDVALPARGVFMPKPFRPADLASMLHLLAAQGAA